MQKKFIERVNKLEQKYRMLADNLVDALWVVDAQTLKYEFITSSAEKISGYTQEEFENMSLKDRLAPGSLIKVQNIIKRERANFFKGEKKIGSFEVELINKDGTLRWSEIKAKFIKENDQPLKIVGTTRDITDQKRAEQTQVDLMNKLSDTIAEVKQLREEVKMLEGMLPVCSGCKRIRDEQGKWWPLDVYVSMKTDAELTHTICPDCSDVMYGDMLDSEETSEK